MSDLKITLGAILAVLTPAVAQNTSTLPAKGYHPVGSGRSYIVPRKALLPTRQQCLYATKDLPGFPIVIREIAFQPRERYQSGPPLEAATVTFTLAISIGPLAPRKYSRTFAANHGTAVTQVFSGQIQLPKYTFSTPQGWHFRIPFQRPFIALTQSGPSIVFDFATSSVVTTMTSGWDLVEAGQDMGSVKFQGTGYSCHFTKFTSLFQNFPGNLYVGSSWSWSAAPLLVGQPGFFSIGDAGSGAKWAGFTLPISLQTLGAPGCLWEIRPLLSFPFVVNTLAQGVVTGLKIPSDPRLANVKLFVQGAYSYPGANALGWLFLPSVEWRIGSFEDHNAAALGSANNSPPSAMGVGVGGDPVPYCRITY